MMAWLWMVGLFVVASAGSPERWLQRSVILDREGRFKVEWGLGDQEDIYFRVEVRTLGYVSIGFSADGSMKDSDMMIGWVADGQVYLQDRYAEGNRMPDLDDQQDWVLISGSENDTHTSLFFKRKLNTCDAQDFPLEYDNTIRLMHAFSYEDPLNEFTIPYHGIKNRGWKSIMLLQPVFTKETEVETWDVMTSEFTVSPEWDTMYWCKFFKGPELSQKHHVTTVETILLEGNAEYVHHVLLNECVGATPEEFDPVLNAEGFDCYSESSPGVVWKCDGYFAGWGRGGSTQVMPDHVGLPLKQSPSMYYMLEVHYDNSKRVTGRPGRAGFRLSYTPKLRQYDAGLLRVGIYDGPNLIIPPGMKNFAVAAHSNTKCTSPKIPEGGINFISVLLHTHILGSSMKLRHFRDNTELPTLAINKHYDAEFQEFHVFAEEVLFQPNDRITFECTYDSTTKNQTTFGGLSTQEEMCNAFFIHYPKINLYGSTSYITKSSYSRLLDLRGLSKSPVDYIDDAFRDFMATYDWNRTAIRRFERELRLGPQKTACFIGNGNENTVTGTVSYPQNLQEYVRPLSICAAKAVPG